MTDHTYTYPIQERLKSHIIITSLFTEGKTVSKYPLRMVFVENTIHGEDAMQIGVSVSKRNFKRAVDRNYYKRLLREAYRLNKHLFTTNRPEKLSIMFFYQSKERLSFEDVNTKMIKLIEKFNLIYVDKDSLPIE